MQNQAPALWDRVQRYIPNGTQTLSKAPNRYVNGVYPKLLVKGLGCRVQDVEGKWYTDFICGLGPIILGYHDEYVDNAVKESIDSGQVLLSLPHPLEGEVAELLNKYIPSAEKTKFFKTGSEAMSAAVKVARAYTNRTKVLVCGYHGWHDWYTASTDKKAGIPKILEEYVSKFEYNNLEDLENKLKSCDIAAVILEPVVYDWPNKDYLKELITYAHIYGALVIFDEIVTGFRFGLGGVQKLYGVIPDLSCFSKAMGNGYPIAALVGKEEYMEVYERPDFFISGTFGGDLIGLSAAKAVVKTLESTNVLGNMWMNGLILRNRFNELCKTLELEDVECFGGPPRTRFDFPSILHKSLFWQECVKRGILFGYSNFIQKCHTTSIIDNTLNVCEDALKIVKENWNNPKLEGDVPVEVFKRV